jgi:hypothetical protein
MGAPGGGHRSYFTQKIEGIRKVRLLCGDFHKQRPFLLKIRSEVAFGPVVRRYLAVIRKTNALSGGSPTLSPAVAVGA